MMKDFFKNITTLKTKDVIVALVILVLPLLARLWLFVPNVEVWETEWFDFQAKGFSSVQIFFWLLSAKLFIVLSLAIWFFTCKNWWRKAILIPLIIEIYKLFNIIIAYSVEEVSVDESEIIKSLPIIVPIIILFIFFTFRVSYYLYLSNIKLQINKEIESMFIDGELIENSKIKRMEYFFNELRNNKSNYTKEEYVSLLFQLRNNVFNIK